MTAYICATHYFGAANIGNFWSTFISKSVVDDFRRIRADGFTHVILIVPWTQFHPDISSVEVAPVYRARLDFLFRNARTAGLRVILRLGYLWELCPTQYSTYDRIKDLPTSAALMRAWKTYFRLMRKEVANRAVFEFAFVSWEDWYWPIYKEIPTLPLEQRIKYAGDSGYRDFLKLRYDLNDLRRRYDITADDWAEIAVPMSTEAAIWEYSVFFDTILSDRIFNAAESSFPGLSFEFRIDEDPLPSREPVGRTYYPWGIERQTSGRQITYYHPQVGKGGTTTHSAEAAATQLAKVLHRFSVNERRNPRVFLDQFNFYTQNPQFPNFSQIDAGELERFICSVADTLIKESSGYAVWGYRDWINDKLYNGTFELGLDGWSHIAVKPSEKAEQGAVLLVSGSRLEQKIGTWPVKKSKVLLQGYSESESNIVLLLSGAPGREIRLGQGRFDERIELGEGPATKSIGIEVRSGSLLLRRVAIYTHMLSSGLYKFDRTGRASVAAMRTLNARLAEAAAPPERAV